MVAISKAAEPAPDHAAPPANGEAPPPPASSEIGSNGEAPAASSSSSSSKIGSNGEAPAAASASLSEIQAPAAAAAAASSSSSAIESNCGGVDNWSASFLESLNGSRIMIVVGDTASQIPQLVMDAADQETPEKMMMIACTQPHGVAALSVSRRVSQEKNVTIGDEVGYCIRFEDRTSSRTILKFLTDEMLLREAMTDPLFERYSVIILDETQERTLPTDILFVLLREVLAKRTDLKLVLISATLGAEKLERYFSGASLMRVPGRHHPVEILYTEKPQRNYLVSAIRTVVQVHKSEKPGDMLVFLTGEEEVEDVCFKIKEVIGNLRGQLGPVEVVPLYPTLPPDKLQRVSQPAPPNEGGVPVRRIVVSTDIAETSLSVDGIAYVVDSGLAEHKFYNPRVRVESLVVTSISKARVQQRSGCAGRTQPGKCFRLYPKESYDDLPLLTQPEILRSNLATAVLILRTLGIDDLVHFDYMDPPPPEALIRALEVLNYLEALDEDGNVTKLGQMMSKFPLDPQMSKMLVISPEFNCSSEILSICAMLSVPNCFVRTREEEATKAAKQVKSKFVHNDGDHLTLLNVYQAYKENIEDPSWCDKNFVNQWALQSADKVRQQLVGLMTQFNLKLCSTDVNSPDYYINIRKAIVAGYYMQVAHRERLSEDYLTVKDNQVVRLHRSNGLDHIAEWVIFHEYVSEKRTFIRTVTDICPEWLVEIAPEYYNMLNFPEGESKSVLEKCYNKEG